MSVCWQWLVIGGILLGGCGWPTTEMVAPPQTEQRAARASAPDFALTTLDGQRVQLSALHGRWVLINFWATWCIPCREEMPYLQALADQHAVWLTVLAINLREPTSVIQPFVDELALRLPILVQPDDQTLLAYGVGALP